MAGLLASADPAEVDIVAHYLAGRLRQRRTGVGWRSLTGFSAAAVPGLTIDEVDAALARAPAFARPGGAAAAVAIAGARRLTGLAPVVTVAGAV